MDAAGCRSWYIGCATSAHSTGLATNQQNSKAGKEPTYRSPNERIIFNGRMSLSLYTLHADASCGSQRERPTLGSRSGIPTCDPSKHGFPAMAAHGGPARPGFPCLRQIWC